MKRTMINYLGLLGVVSLLSYAAAVFFSPLAYPGYDSLSQAVSDLSADDAPSRVLWNRLAALYSSCGIVSVTLVCLYIKDKLTKPLRIGIYLFTAMNWISEVGYKMFPLSESGNGKKFQDIMHIYVVTVLVVLLSIVSFIMLIAGGIKDKKYRYIAVFAAIALSMMFIGTMGTGAALKSVFGVFQRISLFAATGFNAVLGICLFNGFGSNAKTAQK